MSDLPPAFAHQPVVLVHLESGRDAQGRPLAACSGIPFWSSSEVVPYPMAPCPGCLLATRMRQNARVDALALAVSAEAVGRLTCRRCGWPVGGDPDTPDGAYHPWCPEVPR